MTAGERRDFETAIDAAGRSASDFQVIDDDRPAMVDNSIQAFGNVIVRHKSGFERPYPRKPGIHWIGDFTRELRAGVWPA